MKIRTSFVSNSSSTSFGFVFREQDELIDLIKKHQKYFELTYVLDHTIKITYLDIIESIKRIIKKYPTSNIDNIINSLSYNLKSYLLSYHNPLEYESIVFQDSYTCSVIYDLCYDMKKLTEWKRNGLTNTFVITFGDNEGDITGNVGLVMDYEGRYIELNENDLKLFITNNH